MHASKRATHRISYIDHWMQLFVYSCYSNSWLRIYLYCSFVHGDQSYVITALTVSLLGNISGAEEMLSVYLDSLNSSVFFILYNLLFHHEGRCEQKNKIK